MHKFDIERWKQEWEAETDQAALEIVVGLKMYGEQWAFWFWKFVHNALVHPLMAWPWDEPEWLNRLHDWTAKKCWGAG